MSIHNIINNEFKNFIVNKKHPCIMANAVFKTDNYILKVYDDIRSDVSIDYILSDIDQYIKNYNFESNSFESLIFCFKNNNFSSELEFEKELWNFLQKLHNKDTSNWDETVASDPEDPHFSFSLKSKAFYIIGMHPKSSRLARKAPYCTVVFNLHWQFEKLRQMGTYQNVKKRIRWRDKALQGSVNPVLEDFGEESESKQYSGRAIEREWKCPFHPQNS